MGPAKPILANLKNGFYGLMREHAQGELLIPDDRPKFYASIAKYFCS